VEIGIFSRTFTRPRLEPILDAVAAHGLSRVHFNLKSAGLASLPDELDQDQCLRIHRAFESRKLIMTSISGTFNAIHPDIDRRMHETQRACRLIERCPSIGTSVVSLCTGSRDPQDMWKRHRDNQALDAWRDLLATLAHLLPIAENSGVTLGIEPETNNVVDSAAKARRLLDEQKSSNLKIIMDGANLFHGGDISQMQTALTEAFELLAPDLILVHAKDIPVHGDHANQAIGTGLLDWETYCGLLKQKNYDGTVILHNVQESDVSSSVSFLRDHLSPRRSGATVMANVDAIS
jgi:sugar phosphate isomerase/epimerase